MKNIIIKLAAVCILPALCFTLGACSKGADVSLQASADKQAETVIVKETVYVTEPSANSAEQDISSEIETQPETESETVADKKGYTTADILKKAAEAAEKQYWVAYFQNNYIQMTTFDALENFTVTMNSDGWATCDKLVGECIVYYWDSDKNGFEKINDQWNYKTKLTRGCSEIIGGNCDIYDEKNDTVIKAKTE